MADKTKIEWAETTWNPVTGCSHAGSPGCDNCYAARLAATRLKHHPNYKGLAVMRNGHPRWTGEVRFNPKELEKPFRWKKPRRIFVVSMGDLFHEDVPFESVADIFQVIADCPQHTFLILTKQPERMKLFFDEWWNPNKTDPYIRADKKRHRPRLFLRQAGCSECSHFFLGCLNGRKKWKDEAITPNWRASGHEDYFGRQDSICDAFRWARHGRGHGVAVEMDNGEISVRQGALDGPFPAPLRNLWLGITAENQQQFDERWEYLKQIPTAVIWICHGPALGPIVYPPDFLALGKRVWLVSEGESGPGARPSHPDYFRQDRDQCVEAGVPWFFKQWGNWCPDDFETVTETGLTPKRCWVHIDPFFKPYDWAYPYNCEQMMWRTKKAAGRLLDGREWNEYPST